jgi:hypothetical protein
MNDGERSEEICSSPSGSHNSYSPGPLTARSCGQWKCGAGASIAYIEMGIHNRATAGPTLRLSAPWTEIRESQDGFNGNYFVGYDRDKRQFLMIDADDPALVA